MQRRMAWRTRAVCRHGVETATGTPVTGAAALYRKGRPAGGPSDAPRRARIGVDGAMRGERGGAPDKRAGMRRGNGSQVSDMELVERLRATDAAAAEALVNISGARAWRSAAIEELRAVDRTVFVLGVVDGRSNPDIAATLDLTVPAVKARVYRARLRLRRRLRDYLNGDTPRPRPTRFCTRSEEGGTDTATERAAPAASTSYRAASG